MKKAIATTVLIALAASTFMGCSGGSEKSGSETNAESTTTVQATTTTTTEATTTTTTEATTTETTINRMVTVNSKELDELIAKQPVYIKSTKYVVQDSRFKTLYPDLLQAIIMNNSKDDIKNAIVVFVAWDENNLPVKIKGEYDYSDGDYIAKCNYDGINLIPGKTYGKDSGLALAEGLKIKKFKAIVYEYETFDGTTWTNPYYHAWSTMYGGGTKLKDDMTVEAYLTDEDYEEMIKKTDESKNAEQSTTKET